MSNELTKKFTKKLYSIYDEKADVMYAPYVSTQESEAIRHFASLVLDDYSMMHKFPEDFKLLHVGYFCDKTGLIAPVDGQPLFIINGVQIKNLADAKKAVNDAKEI